jgi:hypothetical protein
MQRIKDWINEPREGWYHGRRVALTSNLYNDAIHYQFTVQDFDARVDGIGCSTVIEVAWFTALAALEDRLAIRRSMSERRALESASSVERAPHDSERDGRAAE